MLALSQLTATGEPRQPRATTRCAMRVRCAIPALAPERRRDGALCPAAFMAGESR
jgi:hypothetical protein